MPEIIRLDKCSDNYSTILSQFLWKKAPNTLTVIGNSDFSSSKCPGGIILKTYDLVKQSRETGVTVNSGFHSALERLSPPISIALQNPCSQ